MMMSSQTKIVLPLVVICLTTLVGCRQKTSDCLVRVGDHELTATELRQRANNVGLLIAHHTGKTDEYKDRDILRSFMRGYADIWVQDRAIEDYMKKNGLEVPVETIEELKAKAFQNFRSRKDRKVEDFNKIPGFSVALWEDQVLSEARRKILAQVWNEQFPTNFTRDYAEAKIAAMLAWNDAVPATNALIYAYATNLWKQACACDDFAKFAREHTQLNDEAQDNGEWTTVDERFLVGDPPLPGGDVILEHLKRMKPGEIAPPIAADNGLMIIRLDSLEDENCYAVSRVFLRLAQTVHPASPEEIIVAAQTAYKSQLFEHKLAELVENLSVERVQPNVEAYFAANKNNKKGENK